MLESGNRRQKAVGDEFESYPLGLKRWGESMGDSDGT